jgi:hypothetical protein
VRTCERERRARRRAGRRHPGTLRGRRLPDTTAFSYWDGTQRWRQSDRPSWGQAAAVGVVPWLVGSAVVGKNWMLISETVI